MNEQITLQKLELVSAAVLTCFVGHENHKMFVVVGLKGREIFLRNLLEKGLQHKIQLSHGYYCQFRFNDDESLVKFVKISSSLILKTLEKPQKLENFNKLTKFCEIMYEF